MAGSAIFVWGNNAFGKLGVGDVTADIAPTVLQLLGLPQPPEMLGETLIIDPASVGQLPDGPRWTRPPSQGIRREPAGA